MEDKGEVKCIKFSLGNKILAVQRTLKSVVRNIVLKIERSKLKKIFKHNILLIICLLLNKL